MKKKSGVENPVPEAFSEEVAGQEIATPLPTTNSKAGKAGKGKKAAGPRRVRTAKPEVPFLESEFGTLEAFTAAFAGTDYELANLPYYFQKVVNWRQQGEVPTRKDWKATASKFFLNDIASNSLVLAPGAVLGQHHTGEHHPTDAGARTGSGRRSRWDA